MLWCVMNLSSILAAYTGFGYLCLALGFGAFTVSSNDATTKQAVPLLAPHMAALSMLLDKACHMERAVLSSINTTFTSSSSSSLQGEGHHRRGDVVSDDDGINGIHAFRNTPASNRNHHHPQDSRVEELSDEDEKEEEKKTSSSRRHQPSSSPSPVVTRSSGSSSSYGRGGTSSGVGGSSPRGRSREDGKSRGDENDRDEDDNAVGWEEDRAFGSQRQRRPVGNDENDGDLPSSSGGDEGVRRRNSRK